jgi:hypothetical protein
MYVRIRIRPNLTEGSRSESKEESKVHPYQLKGATYQYCFLYVCFFQPVLRIRIRIQIRRIRMFLGLLDPDPLVSGLDLDPESGSFHHQVKKVRKTLILTVKELF